MKRLRFAGLIAGLVLTSLPSGAQYVSPYVIVQGSISSSSGLPAANATLTFAPSQVFFVAGTSVVVSPGQCGTDKNGSVVGTGNPVLGPRATAQFTGTLPPGNYYVQFTWYDQFGKQTLPSPEVAVQLTSTGELQILPPVGNGPPQATGMDVYIGTTSGSEQYQGQTTSLTAQYTQAVALVSGNPVPTMNLTACRVVANDAGFPTGTGYTVSLLDSSGNTLFSYPEMWQFFGPGSTYNLSQGIPYYHGQVTYPIPVLTIPYNHNPQSISGPISMTGYNLYNVGALGVGTATPAWGVDVEGTGLDALINAAGGYLVNGSVGAAGTCLGSDGTAYDTPIPCSTSYYQTIQFNGVPVAAQPVINFLSPLTVAAVTGKTNIRVNTTGSEAQVVTANTASPAGYLAVWDAYGGITGQSSNAGTNYDFSFTGCTVPSGENGQCQSTVNFTSGTTPTFVAFPNATYTGQCTTDGGTVFPTISITFSFQGLTTTGFGYTLGNAVAPFGVAQTPVVYCHLHHA